jgi:hemoglobin
MIDAVSAESQSDARTFALRRRAEKREAAERIGVDADFIDAMVDTFYSAIRVDDLLAPIFAERVENWPAHLVRMKAFWRSVLHNSGEFSGNPMLKHLAIPGLELGHFVRWLDLFYATLRQLERHPDATGMVAGRARMIADSLFTAIEMRRSGLAGGRAGRELPHA